MSSPPGSRSADDDAGARASGADVRPKDLMPIGRFARLTDLSHKALRLYASEGFLVPAWTDPDSGYRYYHASQLADAQLVHLLRSLDVPVADLRGIMAASREPARLAAALELHRLRIDREIAERQRLRERLQRLLQGHTLPFLIEDIRLADDGDLSGVSRRATCSHDELGDVEWKLLGDIAEACRALSVTPLGREWTIYHDDTDLWPVHDVEVFQPVEPPEDPVVAARLSVLPGGRLLHAVYEGDYDGIRLAYAELQRWAIERGLRVSDDPRERYLVDERDTDDPRAYRTEIVWPIVTSDP